MIKVIGFANEVAKKVTCRNCSAILEYTPSDTRKEYTLYDYSGGRGAYYLINCPNCNEEIRVK